MTTALHLDTIERLLTRAFPDTGASPPHTWGGPGYHLAELGVRRPFEEEDPAVEAQWAKQVSAEYDALTEALTVRWGAPEWFSLTSVLMRSTEEEIPEPWFTLCGVTRDVHLWRAGSRWLAVCAAQWALGQPEVLLASVTVVDPP